MLLAYVQEKSYVKQPVESVLVQLKVDATALFSTLGRVATRAIEAQVMINQLPVWLSQLEEIWGVVN